MSGCSDDVTYLAPAAWSHELFHVVTRLCPRGDDPGPLSAKSIRPTTGPASLSADLTD